MSNWSEKDIDAIQESMRKLKSLLEPPKKDSDVEFLKDIFNIKEKE